MDMPNLSDRTKEVLDLIIDNPGKTAVDLAAIGKISIGQVNGAISSLNKHKMLEVEDGKFTATVEAEFAFGGPNDVPAPAAVTKAKAQSAAAEQAAEDADRDDADDAVLAQVAATMAAAPATTAEAATETVVESVAADTTAVAEAEVDAEDVVVTSTLIPGRAPASVKPAAEAKPATESKASKARAIFEEMKDRPRKEIMARLMTEVGLTQNGANTYLYNFRKNAGMVKARDTSAVAATTATETSAAATETVAAGEEPAFVPEAAPVENVVIEIAAAETPVAEAVETVEAEEAKTAD